MFQIYAELHGHVQEVRGVESFPLIEGGVLTCSLDGTAKLWSPITKNDETSVSIFQNLSLVRMPQDLRST